MSALADEGLAKTVAAFASQLAAPHLAAVVAAYRTEPCFSKSGAARVAKALPSLHRSRLAALHAAWAEQPEMPGAALGLALEATVVAEASSDRPEVGLVVTGPDSPGAPVRLTSEVVRQLIDDAEKRVMLVSFAAYRVEAVVEALDRAAKRGVTVQLVLESAVNLSGGGGSQAYAKHTVYEWPPAERKPPSAKLHAKAVIVDGRAVLLTSANMTEAAYSSNIELGLLCQGGVTARRVQEHFDGLIAAGVLVQVAS